MNILVTGSKGFVGKNLVVSLQNIKSCKDRTSELKIDEIFEYDINSSEDELEKYCRECDFVFHLAGVNRPENDEDFMKGNFGFTSHLLNLLKVYGNKCPIMISSSIQATLEGRFANSEYGKSKLAGEEIIFDYGRATGAKVLVYRFSNLFGKWCRPNYNSAVATFCNNIANDLPIKVNDRNTVLDLIYIDDLVKEMLLAIDGKESRCDYAGINIIPNPNGKYCYVPITYSKTLGEIVDLLNEFSNQPNTLIIPEIPKNSFAIKLYSTYLSYLPKSKICVECKMNIDERGSFTEVLKSKKCGQISINISKPNITKGQHWHHSKWEFFIVVSGHALIQERKIDTDEILEFEVSGEKIEAVHMLPGYTHNIINLSNTENLVTVMWANEEFDADRPDTYHEEV